MLLKFNPNTLDNANDFFPLYDGLKPSSMGLKKFNDKDKVFLFDDAFPQFRKNKELCRKELDEYYQSKTVNKNVIEFIINKLSDEYPEYFKVTKIDQLLKLECLLTNDVLLFNDYELVDQKTSLKIKFKDALDALSMQVAEDLVIHNIPKNPLKKDYSEAIHLCSCNGWDAKWAIGKSFDYIHKDVSRISKIIPNSKRMMMGFFRNIQFERIAAISFKTTPFLNRHVKHQDIWSKPFNKKKPFLNLRVERQTVTGFPEDDIFLFTIRTYLYDVNLIKSGVSDNLKVKRLKSIISVFSNPDPKSYAYHLILKLQNDVIEWCQEQLKEIETVIY